MMKLQQASLAIAIAASWLALTGNSAGAVTFFRPTDVGGIYSPVETSGSGEVTTTLKFLNKLPTPTAGNDLLNFLNNSYQASLSQNWTFIPAQQNLNGEFVSTIYYACAINIFTPCGTGVLKNPLSSRRKVDPRNSVGASFSLFYRPGPGDPPTSVPVSGTPNLTQANPNLRWIQIVNSELIVNSNVVLNEKFADNGEPPANFINSPPFYPLADIRQDSKFSQDPNRRILTFADASQRADVTKDYDWLAELYLAEIKDPGKPNEVTVYEGVQWGWSSTFTPKITFGGSGGGGFLPGISQHNPIVSSVFIPHPPRRRPAIGGGASPGGAASGRGQKRGGGGTAIGGVFGTKQFFNVPAGRWYDPATTYGFEFQALGDTLFTDILDFPVLTDSLFTVEVGDTVLGEFGPGDSVDFVSLFGAGIDNFRITGIDPPPGQDSVLFPIQLDFNNPTGSFEMISIVPEEAFETASTPEPPLPLGLLLLTTMGASLVWGKGTGNGEQGTGNR